MKSYRNAKGTDKENNGNEHKMECGIKKSQTDLPMEVQFPLTVHVIYPFYVCYEIANTVSNVREQESTLKNQLIDLSMESLVCTVHRIQ